MPRASCPRAQLWGKIRLNYILHTVVIFINLVPHKHTLAGQLEPKNHIEERNFSKKKKSKSNNFGNFPLSWTTNKNKHKKFAKIRKLQLPLNYTFHSQSEHIFLFFEECYILYVIKYTTIFF